MSASLAEPTASPPTRTARTLRDLPYAAQRTGLAIASAAFMELFHRLLRPGREIPPADQRAAVQRRFRALLDQDLANVDAGYYPRHLLFQTGMRDYLKAIPAGVLDLPRVLRRARAARHDDLPADADPARYPRYYRRTFHWQTDGWLSDRSALLYDPGVELLFGGTADIMRRMVVPDLADAIADVDAPRILDVACGTGRFLRQLHEAIPRARLTALDLSPHYLRYARELLDHIDDVSFVNDNAEAMPFAAGTFHAATAIFLFHELPRDVRRTVMHEVRRVLAPGALFGVVCSPQHHDSPDIRDFLDAFPRFYHEPYFKGYLRDPLEDALVACGFEIVDSRPAFVSKIIVARVPA